LTVWTLIPFLNAKRRKPHENYISNRRRVVRVLGFPSIGRIYYLYFGGALYFAHFSDYPPMTFQPGHIISHNKYGVGVVQITDWRNTRVVFCAAEDRTISTRELRKSAIVIDGPALVETHCPPDWDATAELKAAWKQPIPQPQFHPQDSHREILESFARACYTLVLNSVGVFPKAVYFAGRYA